jgi:hypothetical protein
MGDLFWLCLAHVGYFVPLTKIADFLRAGVEVRVPNNTFIHVTKLTHEYSGQDLASWWE